MNVARTLKEIGYRCHKCKNNINDRCIIYDVSLAHDEGCYEHYKPKDVIKKEAAN